VCVCVCVCTPLRVSWCTWFARLPQLGATTHGLQVEVPVEVVRLVLAGEADEHHAHHLRGMGCTGTVLLGACRSTWGNEEQAPVLKFRVLSNII